MIEINVYTDGELIQLKEQIQFLEIEITLLASQKADLEKQVRYYGILYNKHLGDLLEAILRKHKEKLQKKASDNRESKQAYQEAAKEYENFTNNFEESKKFEQAVLTADDQILLKRSFKKACKLCHPDKVATEYKQQAQEIFIALREAYDANDLKKVLEILQQLEKGIFKTISESVTEKDKLFLYFEQLKNSIIKLRTDIKSLMESDAYRVSSSVQDYESYFENLRLQLQAELNKL